MTVEQYLTLSFRTLLVSKRAAREAVAESLSILGIASLARRSAKSLALHERRALSLAAAILPGSSTLVAHAPLHSLEGAECQYVLSLLERASRQRRILASSVRFDAEAPEQLLILEASEVAFVSHDAVLWKGTAKDLATDARKLAVHVADAIDPTHPERSADSANAFVRALDQAGFAPQGQPPRFTVTLGAGASTTDLFSIAKYTNITVLEMIPLVRARAVQVNNTDMPAPAEKTLDPTTLEQSTEVPKHEQHER
jgi:ABC-type multidrug transport system ATPase subunit